MQLTSKDGNMVVDFYAIKYSDGTECSRQMLKVLTFAGKTQSKRYINRKEVQNEVDSLIRGYGYRITRINKEAQLYNSGLGCAC
jgi:hypothetical protein